MATPFVGMIIPVGFNFAPQGWFLCQGQLLSISEFEALFSIIGTTYGGDGAQTFGLPNLQGRTMIGQGTSQFGSFVIGQTSGSVNATILTQNMPIHSHGVNAQAGPGSQGGPGNGLLGQNGSGRDAAQFYAPAPASPPATMHPSMLGMAGGNIPLSVQNPSQVANYIIAWAGIYPSRN